MTGRPIRSRGGGGRRDAGLPGSRVEPGRTGARLLLVLVLLGGVTSAHAVLSGPEWEAKVSQDADLAAATAAMEEEDWQAAIARLERFVDRRPWDDDGFTLLGYAHRKRGEYDRSIEHYQHALRLNPHHLGAMEYLGEAYVETGREDQARELLHRIEATCRRTLGDARWRDGCEEWRELAERIGAE